MKQLTFIASALFVVLSPAAVSGDGFSITETRDTENLSPFSTYASPANNDSRVTSRGVIYRGYGIPPTPAIPPSSHYDNKIAFNLSEDDSSKPSIENSNTGNEAPASMDNDDANGSDDATKDSDKGTSDGSDEDSNGADKDSSAGSDEDSNGADKGTSGGADGDSNGADQGSSNGATNGTDDANDSDKGASNNGAMNNSEGATTFTDGEKSLSAPTQNVDTETK